MQAFDEDGFFLLEGRRSIADDVARVVAEIDPIHQRSVDFLRTRDNEKLFIAEAGNLVFSTHLVLAVRVPARLGREPGLHRSGARHHRARCASLLGAGGLQGAREAAFVPMAPGQRVHVHRAAAVPHVLGRADRRNRRERLPVGDPGVAPPRHARALDDRLRMGVPRPACGCGRGAGARGRHRRVLVAHAAPHRTEHERCGAQGLHRAVRARRCCGERTGCRG